MKTRGKLRTLKASSTHAHTQARLKETVWSKTTCCTTTKTSWGASTLFLFYHCSVASRTILFTFPAFIFPGRRNERQKNQPPLSRKMNVLCISSYKPAYSVCSLYSSIENTENKRNAIRYLPKTEKLFFPGQRGKGTFWVILTRKYDFVKIFPTVRHDILHNYLNGYDNMFKDKNNIIAVELVEFSWKSAPLKNLPKITKVQSSAVTWNKPLKLRTGKQLEPIITHDGLKSPYESCCLFPNLNAHAIMGH